MNKWNKFDPDKGLPHETVVLVFCKDGKTYAGTRLDTGHWEALKHGRYMEEHKNSEILYWTENLGTPPEVVKVFISQPMAGRTNEEIIAQRADALIQVAKKYPDCFVLAIDSFNEGALNTSDPITELGRCVSLMTDADVVVFCDGWGESRGCNVEHEVAVQYGITYVYI